MSGFPIRSLLQTLGTRLRDARPIEHPELEVSAERINKHEALAVAANLVIPRASIVAEWNAVTSSFGILHQEEAWNVDHAQAHPILARTSTGIYTYTFASSYLDRDAIAVATNLVSARLSCNATVVYPQWTISGITVNVFLSDVDVAPMDARFWLEVL
jgi:hypothetical protein